MLKPCHSDSEGGDLNVLGNSIVSPTLWEKRSISETQFCTAEILEGTVSKKRSISRRYITVHASLHPASL